MFSLCRKQNRAYITHHNFYYVYYVLSYTTSFSMTFRNSGRPPSLYWLCDKNRRHFFFLAHSTELCSKDWRIFSLHFVRRNDAELLAQVYLDGLEKSFFFAFIIVYIPVEQLDDYYYLFDESIAKSRPKCSAVWFPVSLTLHKGQSFVDDFQSITNDFPILLWSTCA